MRAPTVNLVKISPKNVWCHKQPNAQRASYRNLLATVVQEEGVADVTNGSLGGDGAANGLRRKSSQSTAAKS